MEDIIPLDPSTYVIDALIADLVQGGTPTGEGFNSAAITKLGAIGPVAIEPLIAATRAGTPWARANAAMALAAIGDSRASVVEALSQAWLDPNKIVSICGRMALLRLPHPTEPELLKRVNKGVDEKARKIMLDITQRRRPTDPET